MTSRALIIKEVVDRVNTAICWILNTPSITKHKYGLRITLDVMEQVSAEISAAKDALRGLLTEAKTSDACKNVVKPAEQTAVCNYKSGPTFTKTLVKKPVKKPAEKTTGKSGAVTDFWMNRVYAKVQNAKAFHKVIDEIINKSNVSKEPCKAIAERFLKTGKV
jgi:hypothetical protein